MGIAASECSSPARQHAETVEDNIASGSSSAAESGNDETKHDADGGRASADEDAASPTNENEAEKEQ